MGLSQDDVVQILKLLEGSKFEELHLEAGDLKLIVRKSGNPRGAKNSAIASQTEGVVSEMTIVAKPSVAVAAIESQRIDRLATSDSKVAAAEEEGFLPVRSPVLGTFYKAPSPGDPPFVEVGSVVTEEDTVCMVEVMKLFIAIKAGTRGRIARICAEDGQMVEYQQTLFLIAPDRDGVGKESAS